MALFGKGNKQRKVTTAGKSASNNSQTGTTPGELKEALEFVKELKVVSSYKAFDAEKKRLEQRMQKIPFLMRNNDFSKKFHSKGFSTSAEDQEYLERLIGRISAELK